MCSGVPRGWDEIAAGAGPRLSERWLELGAARSPDPYLTFVLTDGGTCVMALGGAVADRPRRDPRLDPHAILAGAAVSEGLGTAGEAPWRDVPPHDAYPCAVLAFPHYELEPVGRRAGDPAVAAAFVDALLDWARGRALRAVAFLYLTPAAGPLTAALRDRGFAIAPLTRAAALDVRWTDFDGYLATLPRKRRVAVRRELTRLDEAGVAVASRPLAADEPDVLRLRGALLAKYGGHGGVERDAALLDGLRERFAAGELTVMTASLGGRLLAFTLLVRDGPHWTALMTGSDYGEPASRLAYFATTYYGPAREAPARGVRTIGYGPGSTEAKRLRGCRLTPLLAAGLRLGERADGLDRAEPPSLRSAPA